jgi:hypothetical protein
MTPELKPCVYGELNITPCACGENTALRVLCTLPGYRQVECASCLRRGPTGSNSKFAIERWNTRPGEAEAFQRGVEATRKVCADKIIKYHDELMSETNQKLISKLGNRLLEAARLCETVEVKP